MKITVYQNAKKVYTGYIPATTEQEIIKTFSTYPLPVTHQGNALQDGDLISIDSSDTLSLGFYHYHDNKLVYTTAVDPCDLDEMNGVRVLMLQPGFPACETRLISRLERLQNAVSDHGETSLIEYSFPYPDDCMILGNEEAKLINMPLNRIINDEIYAGTIYVVKDDHYGNLIDLTDEEITRYINHIGQAQTITQDDIIEHPYLRYFGY